MRGRFYGAAVRADHILQDADYRAALVRECLVLVPELVLKWAHVEPQEGNRNFQDMDVIAALAFQSKLKLRGHTLLWHKSVPVWAEQRLTADRGWAPIESHIEATVTRYDGVVGEWDVVNEPIDPWLRSDGLREGIFLQAFDEKYIHRALRQARKLAPKSHLLINEYGLEYDDDADRKRRFHFLKLLERLCYADVPLDGVGLQSHLELEKGPFRENVYARFLQQIADLGLKITITELDVKEWDYTLSVERRDQRAADAVRALLSVVRDQPALRGITSWGLIDRYSWLGVTASDLARYPNAW